MSPSCQSEAGALKRVVLKKVRDAFVDENVIDAEWEALRRALRPGGRLVIVEIVVQADWNELEGVPDRGGHGISPDDLLEEMASDGWAFIERHNNWGDEPDHYCFVFR